MYKVLDSSVQLKCFYGTQQMHRKLPAGFLCSEIWHHVVVFQFRRSSQPPRLQKKDVKLPREMKANSDSHTCRKLGTFCLLKRLEDFPHVCVRDVPFKAVTSVPMPREGTRLQFRVKWQLSWSPPLTSQNQGTWRSRSFYWVPWSCESNLQRFLI